MSLYHFFSGSPFYHRSLLKKDGTVWGWGKNMGGEYGDNSEELFRQYNIQGMSSSSNIVQTIITREDGRLELLGNALSPVKIKGLENIKEIYAGGYHC